MYNKIKVSKENDSEGRCPIFNHTKKEGLRINNFDLVKDKNIKNCWEVDKQRILFSTAFWRLQNKTQIYIATLGDHYTNRMNHTLIVNEIARNISKKLKLNMSLTEAISLGHDLGHTPFGHGGEQALDEILLKYGETGFKHNIQGARVGVFIEYDKIWNCDCVGLGLTWEVVSGIVLHTKKDEKEREFLSNLEFKTTPESRVVFHADEIAQRVLDIDDGLRVGLLKKEDIEEIWDNHFYNKFSGNFKSTVIEKYIDDIANNEILFKDKFSDMYAFDRKLQSLIKSKIHKSKLVKIMNARGSHIIKELFKYYIHNENWKQLPESITENVDKFGLTKERVLANYIASMSDSYAEMEYHRIFRGF